MAAADAGAGSALAPAAAPPRQPIHTVARREAAFVALGVLLVLLLVGGLGYGLQELVQRDALTPADPVPAQVKQQREIDKLTAEVKRIRSDTGGSLYWLKLAGLFVTVGGAVGGYLLAQSRSTRRRVEAEERQQQMRIAFERRVQVDGAFQQMVQELSSSESPVLRAAAAMKLGKVLEAPPVEWHLTDDRRDEVWSLVKQILAASLAIEAEPKVLKAVTIAIALHAAGAKHGDLSGLDFSLARGADAYWARINFRGADFYRANLTRASFRGAELCDAQFRETALVDAVLAGAMCHRTNFKYTDLRRADLSGAHLTGAKFEETKVHGVVLTGATWDGLPDHVVDLSPEGDGSRLVPVQEWATAARRGTLAREPATSTPTRLERRPTRSDRSAPSPADGDAVRRLLAAWRRYRRRTG